ncbi:MAG: alpha/beta hydrolase family protein [Actinomycetota bacterium]
MAERTKVETTAGAVSLALDGPEDSPTLVVLAPGAGAGLDSDFMVAIADGLAARGLLVARFNFFYIEKGKRSPDRQQVLETTFSEVVNDLEPRRGGRRLVLGGKSLGGRIASHVVAAGTQADGLVFLGYPLHAPGRPDRVRDAHLREISTPMLFVEGTRDPFCPLSTLDEVRSRLTAATEVAIIEGGDHSFKVRASSGRTTRQAWAEVVDVTAAWLERLG